MLHFVKRRASARQLLQFALSPSSSPPVWAVLLGAQSPFSGGNTNTMDALNDFNRQLIEEYRTNGGKVTGQFAGAALLLLTTTGARSGQSRTNPLAYS
jgi:hypothetical protein